MAEQSWIRDASSIRELIEKARQSGFADQGAAGPSVAAGPASLESLLRHDRAIVLIASAAITLVAWTFMLHDAQGMQETGICQCLGATISGPDVRPWSFAALLPIFLMWANMMVAMMIPSAAPTLLTFSTVNRRRREQERPFIPTGIFLAGYLSIWFGFSLAATVLQWMLHSRSFLSPMMKTESALLGGIILLGAGLFQWTPWKQTCLAHCRSPLAFLLGYWREGRNGAFRMGLQHGAYCTGCCWFLMLLLFVSGVMNMTWVALLSILVLLERMLPARFRIHTVAGLILCAWGSWMITTALR